MKDKMIRITTIGLTLALILVLVGCSQPKNSGLQNETSDVSQSVASQSTQNDSEPIAPEIVDSGYWLDDLGDGFYAILIKNPNTKWAIRGAEINITCKDAEGNIIDTVTNYLDHLYAEGTTAVCGQTLTDGTKTLEFKIIEAKHIWIEDDRPQSRLDEKLYIDDLNESVASSERTVVTGQVVNKTENELALAKINVVFKDGSGKILGGINGYPNTIVPDSTTPFSVEAYCAAPTHASIEAYIDPGNLIS